MFLPGESQGRGSPVGGLLWGGTESDMTEATLQQQQQQDTIISKKSEASRGLTVTPQVPLQLHDLAKIQHMTSQSDVCGYVIYTKWTVQLWSFCLYLYIYIYIMQLTWYFPLFIDSRVFFITMFICIFPQVILYRTGTSCQKHSIHKILGNATSILDWSPVIDMLRKEFEKVTSLLFRGCFPIPM